MTQVERLGAATYQRSLFYPGLRGWGRRSASWSSTSWAPRRGGPTDVQEVGTNADFLATFARMAARLLVNMSRRHRAKQRIERALAVVKAIQCRDSSSHRTWTLMPLTRSRLGPKRTGSG